MAISRARCGLYLFGDHVHLSRKSSKGWKVCNGDFKIHRFAYTTVTCRRTCLHVVMQKAIVMISQL